MIPNLVRDDKECDCAAGDTVELMAVVILPVEVADTDESGTSTLG